MLHKSFTVFLAGLALSGLSCELHAEGAWNFQEASIGQVFVQKDHTTCGGSVVGADLVLTAAHCVTKLETSETVSPAQVTFSYAPLGGTNKVYKVSDIAIDPDFVRESIPSRKHIARDIAFLRLDENIPGVAEDMSAFDPEQPYVALLPSEADAVFSGEPCPADYENDKIVVLSCERAKGSSGMPAYSLINGKRKIVAVISASGSQDDQSVTFAVNPLRNISSVEWSKSAGATPTSY